MNTEQVALTSDRKLVQKLDNKLDALERRLMETPLAKTFYNPNTPPAVVMTIMKYLHLSITEYQFDCTESVFTAVGRLPKDSQQLIHKAILVQIEEVNHGVMALNDYGKLGGDISAAKTGHRSPAGLAAAAVIRFLGERVSPFCHIGFMYLFEELTRRLMIGAVPVLRAKGFPEKELEFMQIHIEEEQRHADLYGNLIEEVAVAHPESVAEIEYGFDCFEQVYPVPVWKMVYERAMGECANSKN
jgi:hypothetical protein